MAMGGSHKAVNGNRGRPYGLMLLLAFGAALLGVMVLHKLRERRIFNLLVKEKDQELISLQLLLQKEREYGKEMKRKTEEMKDKIYTLRTQKMELDRRLLEMQSTIDSLKDEQKTMESALEEKQNEIKIRREAEIDSGKEISQSAALKERLEQKEAEIEDLKHRLEYSIKVQSLHSDDPLYVPVNLTNTIDMAEKDKDFSEGKGGNLSKSTNLIDGENSTTVEYSQEEGFKNGVADEGQLKKIEYYQEEGGFGRGDQVNIANSTEAIVDAGESISKLGDQNGDTKDDNGNAISKHAELGKSENSQDENQEVRSISKGGSKLEIQDARIDGGSRLRRKHGHVARTKAKRWRILARNRDPVLRSRIESQTSNEGAGKREGREIHENPQEIRKAVDSADAKLVKAQNLEDTEYMKNRDMNTDTSQLVEQENEMLKTHGSLERESQRSTTIDDESTKDEEEENGIKQNVTSRDNYEQENIGRQVKDGDKPELTDEAEVTDGQESETESTKGDSFRESNSNLEEDKEEYKEEIDESEF